MSVEIAVLLGIAGLVVLMWPTGKGTPKPLTAALSPAATPTASTTQSFQSAMLCLAQVRSRLLVTDTLTTEAKAAIETLTHSLVEASDK